MSTVTKIEWTEATWNVVSGCTKVSPGCDHCYIERTPPFRINHRKFDKPGTGATTGVWLHADRLFQPFSWKKPKRIFVCPLADLFHADVPDLHIAKTWATMARTPHHTYQVLTKRPARMRSLLSSHDFELMVEAVCGHHDFTWPLPNVWGGVSAEDQERADLRIPILMETPLAVPWVSVEPMLGPVDLYPWLTSPQGGPALSWVVVGGESGPGARPMELEWAEDAVIRCQSAGVPVLVKQLGTVTGGRDHHDMATFPESLRVREYPQPVSP